MATGIASSTSEARRQIKNGGIKLNGVVVSDEKMTLTNSNATPEGVHILVVRQKRHFQLKPEIARSHRVGGMKLRSKVPGDGMNLRNRPGAIAVTGLTEMRGALGGPTAS